MLSISHHTLPASLLPLAQTQQNAMMLDLGQKSPQNSSLLEAQERAEESDDETSFEPKDPARLTSEERQFLLSHGVEQEEWEEAGYDLARIHSSSVIKKEPEKSSEEILVEEAEALRKQFGPNGLLLSSEQRRVLYKRYLYMHLKTDGLRSPQHYPYFEELSEPLSVEDCMWPGAVGYEKANRLKRGYIDPEDLTQRLCKLKPSENFELRRPPWPEMTWEKSPVYEQGYTISPPEPELFFHQVYAVTRLENINHLRRSYADLQHEVMEPWNEAMRGLELSPTPDSHLLNNMGRSPGGTLFPRYLIKGLQTIREEANRVGDEYYNDEYNKIARAEKEEAINNWKQRNPDATLQNVKIVVLPRDLPADFSVPLYKAWPADLMEELRETDREAVRRGRRRYIDLLRETEKKMQELVTFWRDCKAITGQRSPPLSWWLSSWWQHPESYAPMLWPPRLKERLDAIEAEAGSRHVQKRRLMEMSRWKEAILDTGCEPTSPGTSFPQSLLDELDAVWDSGDYRFYGDEKEDAMIAKISQWRKSKDGQRTQRPSASSAFSEDLIKRTMLEYSRQETSTQQGDSDLALVPEAMRLCNEGSRRRSKTSVVTKNGLDIWKDRLRPRTKTIRFDEQTSWRDRLRPRRDVASRDRTRTVTESGKPRGITKQHGMKASKKTRQLATEPQANTPITPQADELGLSGTRTSPASFSVAKPARPKRQNRRLSSQLSSQQPHGIRKPRSGKGKQVREAVGDKRMTEYEQGLLYECNLKPPQ